jgi:aryl-alcohol dehydrogenase-like predicted oxidoreductase
MKQRILGRSGLATSAVGLGCMSLSDAYGPADEDGSVRTIHRAWTWA